MATAYSTPGDAPVRSPYWLDAPQRHALTQTLADRITDHTLTHTTRTRLHAVLIELGVASARTQVHAGHTNAIRLATGRGAATEPVRLSDDELDAVLALPDVPAAVRDALAPEQDAA